MVARADAPRYYDIGTYRHCPMVLVPMAKRTAPVKGVARALPSGPRRRAQAGIRVHPQAVARRMDDEQSVRVDIDDVVAPRADTPSLHPVASPYI